eukprot:jgi/Chrzof1/15163/Cz09g29190.t1
MASAPRVLTRVHSSVEVPHSTLDVPVIEFNDLAGQQADGVFPLAAAEFSMELLQNIDDAALTGGAADHADSITDLEATAACLLKSSGNSLLPLNPGTSATPSADMPPQLFFVMIRALLMSWHDPQGTLPSRIDAARRLAVAMGYSRETTEQVIARALLANSAVLYSLQDSYKALQEGRSPQLTAHHFQQSAAFDNWVAAELAAAKQSLKLQSRLQNFCAVVEVQVLSADHLQRRKDAAATQGLFKRGGKPPNPYVLCWMSCNGPQPGDRLSAQLQLTEQCSRTTSPVWRRRLKAMLAVEDTACLQLQVRHCKDGQESTLSSPYDPHSICKHELLAETALPLEALAALAAAQCKQAGTAQWLEVKAPLYLPEDVAHGADGHGLVIATSSMSSRIGSGFSKAAAPARGDVSSFTSGSGEACGGASDLMFLRDVGAVDHGQELGLGDKMHVQSPGRDQIVQTVQTGQGQGQSQTGAAVASQQPSQHGADQSNHQQTSGKLAGGAADAGNSICQQTHLGPSSMQHSKRLVYDPLDMIAYNDDHRQPGGFITLRVRVCAERRLPILPEQPKPSPVLQQDQSNAATHPSSPTAASSSSSTCSQSQSNASGLSPAALAPMANPSSTDTTDTSASCTKLGMLKRSNALTVDGKRAAFAALYGIGPSPPLPTKQPTRDTKQSQGGLLGAKLMRRSHRPDPSTQSQKNPAGLQSNEDYDSDQEFFSNTAEPQSPSQSSTPSLCISHQSA